MFASRRIIRLALPFAAVLALAACQGGGSSDSEFEWQPVFGDMDNDISEVIARVAGAEITEEDLDLHFDQMPDRLKRRYDGEEGRKLLLRDMVDQVLMVRGAIDLELYNDRRVARTMISQRRSTYNLAMRELGILAGAEPAEEELQEFFEHNRDRYEIKGLVQARHVECMTREDADLAYERVTSGEYEDRFPYVVGEMSVNDATREMGGALGWFNEGGFIGNIRDSDAMVAAAYALPVGIHQPVYIGDRWHVIEILKREPPRPMTYNEARASVLEDFRPRFEERLVDEYLAEAHRKYPPELLGGYAPGGGASDEELYKRAMAIPDPERRLELLEMMVEDYPESPRAGEALFMAAHAVMERYGDRRQAAIFLSRVIEDYPNSEIVEDARYLLDNMDNPNAWAPQSIEDLRK